MNLQDLEQEALGLSERERAELVLSLRSRGHILTINIWQCI
jgi:hypothetical protein